MLSIEDFQSRQPDLLALLRRFVEAESPSGDKAAVDRLGKMIAAEMKDLGAQVQVVSQAAVGDILIGRWNQGGSSAPVLALCHMDTVYPLGILERQPWIEKDGRLYGPGVLDMKGGIALCLTTIQALQESHAFPNRPVTVMITTDEEVGSCASRELIQELALQSGIVFCLEPSMPDGSLKTWRKGVGDFEIVARGRAAHAGADHQAGRNAIEELAYHIPTIQKLTDYEKGTTLNVGLISGGTASNVVPEEARLTVDLRVMETAEADRILAVLQSIHPVLEGTSLLISGGLNRPPMPRDELMVQTFQKAKSIAARLGMHLTEGGTGGGSDANFVAPLGIPVLDGLGLQGGGAHSEREYVVVAAIPQKAALLAALISEW